MKRKPIGRAAFLRHGETDYTNVFPDLTDAGKRTILKSGRELKAIRDGLPGEITVAVASSPAVRAMGSAFGISNVFGFAGKIVEIIPLLGPVELRDEIKAKALFFEFAANGGMKGLCVSYGTDPRCEDGLFIEPRSEVQKRLYKYLGMLVQDMLVFGQENRFVIHVSHYEVLYHLVENVFWLDYEYDLPLGYGEVILVHFYDAGYPDAVEMDIEFRGKMAKQIIFSHKECKIAAGP